MGKKLIITEKPSVAREFAAALKENMKKSNGYMESEHYIITWCVGHLVTMCYPDAYDSKLKRWSLDTIPFIPTQYRYEIIQNVKEQFQIIKKLFNRDDIDCIYNAGDSGREGEYIQRLVMQEAGYNKNATLKRVWIDSQTEDEILRGIKEAKDMSEYDNLSNAAYLRAKEDYLMGINFSRALTLKFGNTISSFLKADRTVVAVGRVMTCVQGMVVNREREIRNFVKTPFYKVNVTFEASCFDKPALYIGEWKVTSASRYFGTPYLYNNNGFTDKDHAKQLCEFVNEKGNGVIVNIDKKKQTKNPPLLYNLAELQNDCSKLFKISPDQTLKIAQELYEKKMTTYPRTDARVLSSAVSDEILKNLSGLKAINMMRPYVEEIIDNKSYVGLKKSRYVNDKQITDHYAIIPTGQGINNLSSLSDISRKVYEVIVRRFLAIFFKAAVYQKISLETLVETESFFSNYKTLLDEGYLKVMKYTFSKPKDELASSPKDTKTSEDELEQSADEELEKFLQNIKKNTYVKVVDSIVKEGETSPPKRYNSGSIILAMENAGQLIEDEELRAQIRGSGIGTSATRAEILNKLVKNKYLSLNNKTQIITPTLLGEIIFDVVAASIKPLLDPELTASWEKGLTQVANGSISTDEYLVKLNGFVVRRTDHVKQTNISTSMLYNDFNEIKKYY